MKKVACLYYSGVGNTKTVVEYMKEYLIGKGTRVDIYSVEELPEVLDYESYAGIIIGFPTIHCTPPKRMMSYITGIEKLSCSIPVFIFTTCGLYQANTTRIFAKACRKKNMVPVMDASYRMPAVDGMLLTKRMHFLETCEKNLSEKIRKQCDRFFKILEHNEIKEKIPYFRWYSVLNYPNKQLGLNYVFPIFLNKNSCIHCGKCIRKCPTHAITMEKDYPVWNKILCDRCYRCIHHCPAKALSLKKKHAPARVWKPFRIQ